MAKPRVSPNLLKAIATAVVKGEAAGKPVEASPRTGATEKQSIRPARTAIAHQRGGNKGK
jgi:hypothetical protein